jgi:hypothetical protein
MYRQIFAFALCTARVSRLLFVPPQFSVYFCTTRCNILKILPSAHTLCLCVVVSFTKCESDY